MQRSLPWAVSRSALGCNSPDFNSVKIVCWIRNIICKKYLYCIYQVCLWSKFYAAMIVCFEWVINVFNSYFPIANVYFDIQIVCDLNGMQSKLNNIWMQSSSSSYYLHLFKVSLSYLKLLGKNTPDKFTKNGKSTFQFFLFSSTGKSGRWKNVNEKLKFNAILYF